MTAGPPHPEDPGGAAETGDDLAVALLLADRADAVTRSGFRRAGLVVHTKQDRTPVSEVDRSVELGLREELASLRPRDLVVGEEYGESVPAEGAAGSRGRRRWIIDPIDGTKNFVRGIPVWATLLALEVDGRIEVGVASAPALGRRWWAARGRGAFAAGPGVGAPEAIRVSTVSSLGEACVSGGALSDWVERGGPQRFVELSMRCAADRGLGDFWSHVLVAEGACDVGVDPVVSLWDLAALQVIVEEAGGRFTDFSGAPRADGGSAVSSNGLLHQTVLEMLGAPSGGA